MVKVTSSLKELSDQEATDIIQKISTAAHIEYLTKEERPTSISVSLILPECIRKSYYEMNIPVKYYNFDSLNRMLKGSLLHEIKITDGHELELIWNGITAHVDEYLAEYGLLWDKKTTSYVPDRRPWPYHTRQLEYYMVELEDGDNFHLENGEIVIDGPSNRIVKKAAIAYYPQDKRGEVDEFIRPIVLIANLRDKEVIKKEMLFKKDLLVASMIKRIPPPRKFPSWDCSICLYVSQCFKDGDTEKDFKDILDKYGR